MGIATFFYLDNPSDEDFKAFPPTYLRAFNQHTACLPNYMNQLLLKERWQIDPGTETPIGRRASKVTIAAYYEEATDTAVSLCWHQGFYRIITWDGMYDSITDDRQFHSTKLRLALEELSDIISAPYNLERFLSFGEEDVPDYKQPAYTGTDYGKWA